MLWLAIAIAFYLALNLGANDVANSMGTSVGSKAISLRQAIVVAGVFEFCGAVLFGHGVSQRLVTGVLDLQSFVATPSLFLLAMLAVLLAAGIWLNLATWLRLPVSSSHATVGALAGVGVVAIDWHAVQWPMLGLISLTWMVTPLVSGVLATVLYRLLRELRDSAANHLQEWIPWLSMGLMLVFGVIVVPTLVERLQVVLLHQIMSDRAVSLAIGGVMLLGLTTWLLQLPSSVAPEKVFGRLQTVSACFVAFAHGSNDVGNAIAPLAAMVQTQRTQQLPLAGLAVPLWVMLLGGVGIVVGLAIWGKQVIATIGEGIMTLTPSGGFSAEMATAVTILLASRFGLPISTSHALVGGVVGVGLAQAATLQTNTLKSIALTWIATIPLAALIAALIFQILRQTA